MDQNIKIIEHTTEIRIRYADTDKMGVVYNGNYFTFFEIGRTELMRSFGLPYVEVEAKGYLLPLIEAKARYISPAYYDDILSINAKLALERKPTLKFEYNILRGDTTIAKGHTEHVFLNSDTMKPVRPPAMFMEIINKYNK